jgi:hypothetical protein
VAYGWWTVVRPLLAVAVTSVVMMFAVSGPANASHCGGEATIDRDGGNASSFCHGNQPGVAPGNGGSAGVEEAKWNAYCTAGGEPYQPGGTVVAKAVYRLDESGVRGINAPLSGEYAVFQLNCRRADGTVFIGGFRIFTTTPPVDPEVLRDRARARINISDPAIGSNPPYGQRPTVVHFETWLWTEDPWEVKHESESAGFVRVDVWARPDNITWEFGDGGSTVCPGPGIAWIPAADAAGTYCSYTFKHSTAGLPGSATSGSATVTWIFSWAINGVGQGDFGSFNAATSFSIQVAEIQAVESSG